MIHLKILNTAGELLPQEYKTALNEVNFGQRTRDDFQISYETGGFSILADEKGPIISSREVFHINGIACQGIKIFKKNDLIKVSSLELKLVDYSINEKLQSDYFNGLLKSKLKENKLYLKFLQELQQEISYYDYLAKDS